MPKPGGKGSQPCAEGKGKKNSLKLWVNLKMIKQL